MSLLHTYPDLDVIQTTPCSFLLKSLWNISSLTSQQNLGDFLDSREGDLL